MPCLIIILALPRWTTASDRQCAAFAGRFLSFFTDSFRKEKFTKSRLCSRPDITYLAVTMTSKSPGGAQRCRLILHQSLAIQLSRPGNAPDDFWMYDSGYMIFQVISRIREILLSHPDILLRLIEQVLCMCVFICLNNFAKTIAICRESWLWNGNCLIFISFLAEMKMMVPFLFYRPNTEIAYMLAHSYR